MRLIVSVGAMVLACTMSVGCSDTGDPVTGSSSAASNTSSAVSDPSSVVWDTSASTEYVGLGFTFKMYYDTGENMFASLAYQCNACSLEDYAAIVPPEGWRKGPTQVLIPEGKMVSTPSFEGISSTEDFLPELPGDEFLLIARTLDGELLEMGSGTVMAVVDVMRDTIFRYPAGGRVHELTSPDGDVFVLFVYEVDTMDFDTAAFEAADALADYPVPEGWTYSTRVLEEELVMATEGVTTVLAIRGDVSSVWQRL